jgi:cellobiose-specific phosphotransferase system component IIB
MIKTILKLSALSLLVLATAGMPSQLLAQNTNKAKAEKKETNSKKPATTPFHGKLKAVDKTAKTISVGEHDLVIQVTSETKLSKNEKPAVLDDGVIGEDVSGAYKKTDDGKLHATMVTFGAKAGSKPKATKENSKETSKDKTAM